MPDDMPLMIKSPSSDSIWHIYFSKITCYMVPLE